MVSDCFSVFRIHVGLFTSKKAVFASLALFCFAFLFGLWFLLRQLRSQVPSTLIFLQLGPREARPVSFPFHFSGSVHFSHLWTSSATGPVIPLPSTCFRGFPALRLGIWIPSCDYIWIRIGISFVFNAIADLSLQLQKISDVHVLLGGKFFTLVAVYSWNSQLVLLTFEVWVWMLSNIWAFSLHKPKRPKKLFAFYAGLFWLVKLHS